MMTLLLGALLAQAMPGMAQVPPSTPSAATVQAAVVVHIKNYKFNPTTVTVKAGQAVEWINDDNDAHTATSASATNRWDSGGIDEHETWTHVFAQAGTFPYLCELHPYMKGTVVVSGSKS
jgi:plastocyanin